MINFTVGPVQEAEEILQLGSLPTPYFRNQSFSNLMHENEAMIKELSLAPDTSKVVFLTASGTGAMEAAVMNTLSKKDKVLIVNGGGFGARFVQMCKLHEILYEEIVVPFEGTLTKEMLLLYDHHDYTAFLVNMHETSIGKLYDMNLISDFCKRNHLFLIVDAISSFLADPFHMSNLQVDVMIASSQKALAVPPGISFLVLSEQAQKRIYSNTSKCMYFDLKDALENGKRGQTPFTPAVGILRQIHARLTQLTAVGIEVENQRIASMAAYFRRNLIDLPVEIATQHLSNAVTPLIVENGKSAHKIFEELESQYDIWVCPNGGELRDSLFRVGHLGDLQEQDYDKLLQALKEIM